RAQLGAAAEGGGDPVGGDPVAVAPVDAALRGVEHGEDLAALAGAPQVGVEHRPAQSAASVAGVHAHPGEAGRRHAFAARDLDAEGEGRVHRGERRASWAVVPHPDAAAGLEVPDEDLLVLGPELEGEGPAVDV